MYPGNLELDAGEVDVNSTGTKAITISQTLGANQLYWLTVTTNADDLQLLGFSKAVVIPVLGFVGDLSDYDAGTMYFASRTYGVMPMTFPGGATLDDDHDVPAVFLRVAS